MKRRIIIVMASCTIALLPITAYADTADVAASDDLIAQPVLEEPSKENPSIEITPDEPLSAGEDTSEDTASDIPEDAETPVEEPEIAPQEPTEDKTAAVEPEPNNVPVSEKQKSSLDIARDRIRAAKAGVMINLYDLKIPASEQDNLLYGISDKTDSINIYDDGEYVLAVVIDEDESNDAASLKVSNTTDYVEPEEADMAGDFMEPGTSELEECTSLTDIPKNEVEDVGSVFMSFLTVVFVGLLKVIAVIF